MKLRLTLSPLLLLFTTAALYAADTNTFDLFSKGKQIGVTTYTVQKVKEGTKAHGAVEYQPGSSVERMLIDYRIDPDGRIIDCSIGIPRDAKVTFYAPAKDHKTMQILVKYRGDAQNPSSMALPTPDLLFALGDDTSIWQTLLAVAAEHPHPDGFYTLLILGSVHDKDRMESLHLEAPTEAAGTLDGRPLALKHFTVRFASGAADLYTDAAGTLMQADLTGFGVRHVRKNFVLSK